MNKKVKTATSVAFTVAFFLFSVKPAAALDFGKALGGAVKKEAEKAAEKATSKSVEKVATSALKAADKLADPKGPLKYVEIPDVPPEYEGYYALMMAPLVENALDACMPAYLTNGYLGDANTPPMIDTVQKENVTVRIPCDDKKRLITLILSKTKEENNTLTGGWIYAKGTGLDGCKAKATMPIYKLSEKQTFSFKDFVKNEDCKAVADKADKDNKSKSKK